MKKLILFIYFIPLFFYSQNDKSVKKNPDRFSANNISYLGYDRETSIYLAKKFIADSVLNFEIDGYRKFEIETYASDRRRELTSSFFRDENLKNSGLLLGFFNIRGESEVKQYRFKLLNISDAFRLLNSIDYIIKNEKQYLRDDYNGNNIYFEFSDMKIIIYSQNSSSTGFRIRILWSGLDSEWIFQSFKDTRDNLIRTFGVLEPVN